MNFSVYFTDVQGLKLKSIKPWCRSNELKINQRKISGATKSNNFLFYFLTYFKMKLNFKNNAILNRLNTNSNNNQAF
jgi:hypothetical protein